MICQRNSWRSTNNYFSKTTQSTQQSIDCDGWHTERKSRFRPTHPVYPWLLCNRPLQYDYLCFYLGISAVFYLGRTVWCTLFSCLCPRVVLSYGFLVLSGRFSWSIVLSDTCLHIVWVYVNVFVDTKVFFQAYGLNSISVVWFVYVYFWVQFLFSLDTFPSERDRVILFGIYFFVCALFNVVSAAFQLYNIT